MKKFTIIIIALFAALWLVFYFWQNTFATSIEIIPKAENSDPWDIVDCVAGKGTKADCTKWTVWSRYNKELTKPKNELDLWTQFATWIFSWNSIKLYAAYILRFLLQVGLLIGAGMIIISGYKYATAVYKWSDPGKKDIINAIVWVLVIIFSYAIIRILQAATGIG